MSLTRVKPATIATTLTLRGQGESVSFNITYNNCKQSEVQKVVEQDGGIAAVLLMVKEWDTEYPLTTEGVTELEDDRPGTMYAIIEGFYEARRMAKEKN